MTARCTAGHFLAVLTLLLGIAETAQAASSEYFTIEVVDAETSRGVPLVELRTTNNLVYYTDSAGIIAFREEDLMGHEVFFAVKSHGYEYPADGFGFRGVRLKPVAGEKTVIKLPRTNIAERLCRVTGEGIYRDSLLVGREPSKQIARSSGKIVGQDSVRATIYRNKLFWIWGDTVGPRYPLGNFATTAAISELPNRGGLDPSVGVALNYFLDAEGYSRGMVSRETISGPGPIWLGGLTTLNDDEGNERLVASYARVETVGKVLERGLVAFNDKSETFEKLVQFDVDSPMYLEGHPIQVVEKGTPYFYCGYSVPYAMRVRADWKSIQDPKQYEGFTCLTLGSRFAKTKSSIERTPDGHPVWAWKKNTSPLGYDEQEALVEAGMLKREDAWLPFVDIDTHKPCKPTAGSVRWNEYRNRWIAVFGQYGGTSQLGEIWYAEADSLTGPWSYAKKIITHDDYSFYNPVHHPFFDQEGGRRIYLEGTYSMTFSGNTNPTPRYDYNQIMYRLDLADPRLKLAVPETAAPESSSTRSK